jgi:hypothetical protein
VLREDIVLSESAYLSNYWIPRMEELVGKKPEDAKLAEDWKHALVSEISKINAEGVFRNFPEKEFDQNQARLDLKILAWLEVIRQQAAQRAIYARQSRDATMAAIRPEMIRIYTNEQLNELVKRSDQFDKIRQHDDGTYIRKYEPVYQVPKSGWLAGGHFFAPVKRFGNSVLEIRWANTIVIWLMTLVLAICLQFNLLARMINYEIPLKWKKRLIKPSVSSS